MIRGLFQNAVVIHNPRGGRVFSQAIFILRPQSVYTDRELVEEAQRIIEENTSARKRRRIYK